MMQFAEIVQQNHANSRQTNQIAESTSDLANQAGAMVQQLGQTMLDIGKRPGRLKILSKRRWHSISNQYSGLECRSRSRPRW